MDRQARLIALLSDTFDPDTLRAFLRRHVGQQFVDELPPAATTPKTTYIDQVAERLLGRRALTPAFIDDWADRVRGRAAEIRALAEPEGPARDRAAPAPFARAGDQYHIHVSSSPGAQIAAGPASVRARDITITTTGEPLSPEIWKRDIEQILHAILDRTDQLEEEVWSKSTVIFKRLQRLELDGRDSDQIIEHLRATLPDQDQRILQRLIPSIRPITENLAASALWHALFNALTAL